MLGSSPVPRMLVEWVSQVSQAPGFLGSGPCASQKKLAEAPSLLLALVPCLSSIVLQLSDPSSDSHFSVTQLLLLAANWKCSRTNKLSTVTNRNSLAGDAPGFEPQNIRVKNHCNLGGCSIHCWREVE